MIEEYDSVAEFICCYLLMVEFSCFVAQCQIHSEGAHTVLKGRQTGSSSWEYD